MNDPQSLSEEVVFGWYSYLDRVFSLLFFTASITALQFGNLADEIATISILFFCLLGYSLSRNRNLKRHIARLERYKGRVYLFFIMWLKTPVFGLSALFLVAIATGYVTPNTLIDVSFKSWLNFQD
uniref:Uncharacterized protein n=1 Tax=Enterovibrio norvegicus TaxID=188144 RepID=A0A0H4A1Z0_9GAMM|nr:hypothetical protein [Enterovibrio norvegicus]